MKKLSLLLTILISLNAFSQEKEAFETEFNEFVIQCENIGKTIIDKNKTTDLTQWYKGRYKELAEEDIKQLESDINKSLLDVTYRLTKVYKDRLYYRLNFFNENTKIEFGELHISFYNKKDYFVDGIMLLSKRKIEFLELNLAKN